MSALRSLRCIVPARHRGFPSFFSAFLLIAAAVPAWAKDEWTAPTPQELSMTSVAQVPGAPAIYLDYEQTNDEDKHEVIYYVRIKVLTPAGVKYGNVELPYDKGDRYSIKEIEARTIHSDGVVIPFTGKPYDKQVIKSHSIRYNVKSFTMPDVQVGSILEYRYVLTYNPNSYIAPRWYAQRDLFALREHFVFHPDGQPTLLMGGANTRSFEYTSLLPKGVGLQKTKHTWELTMENVPPIENETWMPPRHNVEYKVLFYYINPALENSVDEYWKRQGLFYTAGVDSYLDEKKLQKVVFSIVSPQDGDAVKVAKLYDAMMGLENTDFLRAESEKEEKTTHTVVNSAIDVWNAKRGNGNQIALLFIGLCRAAGLKAYAMWVTDRSQEFFEKNYLDTDQLDDVLAIVVVDGKEEFLDPGARYCPLGDLAWFDSASMGLRQGPAGPTLAESPGAGYRDAETLRSAQLRLDASGALTGTARLLLRGTPALAWRQRALETDLPQLTKEFEDDVGKGLPRGVHVKLTGFDGLQDWKTPLVAHLTVSGTLGTRAGKLLLLPADFFEASAKPPLLPEQRLYAVYMDYAHAEEDDVTLTLPPGMKVEALPKDVSVPLKESAAATTAAGLYRTVYRTTPAEIQLQRVIAVGTPLFPASEYPLLRDFYGRVAAQDQEQVVLQPAAK
jgi:hypothetical protein